MPTSTAAPPLPGYLSWPVVILSLLFFWPIGLVLLGMRLSQDRARQLMLGGVLMTVGMLIGLLFLLMAIVVLFAPSKPVVTETKPEEKPALETGPREKPELPVKSEPLSNGAASIICGVIALGGFSLMGKGMAMRRKRRVVQHYLGLIVNDGLTGIDEIAMASHRADFSRVMAEIQRLIKEGFLPGYRVDVNERKVIGHHVVENAAEKIAFKCTGCGANNFLISTGEYVRCEYCGTPLRL